MELLLIGAVFIGMHTFPLDNFSRALDFVLHHSNVWIPPSHMHMEWIGCMVAVAIVDIWSAYKAIQYVPKGNRTK